MSLEIQINNDIKQAMLDRDKKKLEALRAIKAGLLLEKTGKDVSAGEIPESVELKLLQKLVKQRKESAAKYLPEQMSEADIEIIVQKLIEETGASSMKDMGRVMGMASKQLAGKADNKLISSIIKQKLGN